MARRAKPHDEELPFVALMDTMTNVVGVLIIVLVMIGIGLAKSVQKVLSDLPMVSEQEHEELKKKLKEFDGKKDPAEVAAQIAKLQGELQPLIEKLKALQLEWEKDPVVLVDTADLAKQLEEKRKERQMRKLTIDQLLAEIDKLKIKLDTTPRYQPPPPIAVRLPNARPMPENAVMQRVLVTGGRLMFLRNDELFKIVEEEFKKEDSTPMFLRRDVLKGPDGKPLTKKGPTGQMVQQKKSYYDAQKMALYFNKLFNLRAPNPRSPNKDFLVEVAQVPNSPNILMRLQPRPDGGETVEQAMAQASFFRSQLRAIKADPKSVVWFHVSKDSIPAYLGARDIVDREQVPVGWEIFDKPIYTQNIPGDYLVDFTPPPPPPPPPGGVPPKPPGPPPVVIAAPKATVD